MEERRLAFARDDRGFDSGKTGFFEHLLEFDFGESQPDMAVEFAGLLVRVAEQVEDQNPAAGAQDFMGRLQGALRSGCVVEGLTEKREIDAPRFDRRLLDVAEPVFEIGKSVLDRKSV